MRFVCLCTVVASLLLTGAAFAQSSGNFSAAYTPATCLIGADGSLSGGTAAQIWSANISTSNGKGVTLKITPSMVTGLFTRTKIDTIVPSATADVGIEVCVKVDGKEDGVLPTSCVTYDQRFQQVSSDLFSQISECNTVVCTDSSGCPAGSTCYNPTGLANSGVCVAPTAEVCAADNPCDVAGQICLAGLCNAAVGVQNQLCNFELLLSTLSAHSLDFVVPVGLGKPHVITADWKVVGLGAKPSDHAAVNACVGPGIVTVTQVKVFNNSGDLVIVPEPE